MQKLKAFAESSLFRNSLALFSGTVASQAIVFLFAPFLSRVFSPADFGNLANFNAWVSILALISSLRYEHAVIVARDRESTNRVFVLTASLSLFSVALYVVGAGLIHFLYTGSGYLHNIQGFVLLIPAGVFAICVNSLLIQFNIRSGKFKMLAAANAGQILCTVVAQVAFGLRKVEYGLLIGTIIGSAASGTALCILSLNRARLAEFRRELRFDGLRATAAEFKNFPRYTMAADGIAVVVQQFIPVFILGLFSPALAGLYSFSVRIDRVPLIVIATAVSGALRKEAMDHLDRVGGLLRVYKVTVKSLFLIGLVPTVIMMLFGRPLFAAVFGSQWVDAGRVIQILSPGILFEFVALPLAVFFLVTMTQHYTLMIQAAGFVFLVGALTLGRYVLHDFMATCYLISAVMVVVNLFAIIFAAKVARMNRPTHVDEIPYLPQFLEDAR